MVEFIATAIEMKYGCQNSLKLLEINQIYLENSKDGWYSKEAIHNYVTDNPGTVSVKTITGPKVIPCVSENNEKFVKSTPNQTVIDNLLSLPRK